MSVPNTRELTRRPTHPGEMPREDFLPDYGLTVASLATARACLANPSTNSSGAGEPSARRWRSASVACSAIRPSSG